MSDALIIRPAAVEDAAAMSLLRATSISDLCAADHGNDPVSIAAWIGDRSPDKFLTLLQQPDVTLLVAARGGDMTGLGAHARDQVTLNYVHPAHRFAGVGKAIMAALERSEGVVVGRLLSTATALPFYHAIGWLEVGSGTPEQGYPMEKQF